MRNDTGTAIVIEPNAEALASLVELVRVEGFAAIRTFSSPREALAVNALDDGVGLVFSEVDCGDQDCLELVRVAHARSPRAVCLVGSAHAARAMIAAAILEGADAFIEKPVTPRALKAALAHHRDADSECHHLARRMVGRISMRDAQQTLRTTMLSEALRRTAGSRRATAGLLGIDRRCVQRMVQDLDDASGFTLP